MILHYAIYGVMLLIPVIWFIFFWEIELPQEIDGMVFDLRGIVKGAPVFVSDKTVTPSNWFAQFYLQIIGMDDGAMTHAVFYSDPRVMSYWVALYHYWKTRNDPIPETTPEE